jgi:hypothetical protein
MCRLDRPPFLCSSERTILMAADAVVDLLKTHFRQLRLPTMGREFERLARDAAATNQNFIQFLLGLTQAELRLVMPTPLPPGSKTPSSRS